MIGALRRIACVGALAAAGAALAQPLPQVTQGTAWLAAQVQPSGALANEATSVAATFQSRSEAAQTLKLLAALPAPLVDSAAADTESNTENLARRIVTLAAAGRDISALLSALAGRQNADGGYGGAAGHSSTVIDTAWALLALRSVPAPDVAAVSRGLIFLQSKQGADGSFGLEGPGDVFTTGHALLALRQWASQFALATATQRAVVYLQSQQAAPGRFGASAFESAAAYLALHDFIPLEPAATSVRAYLIGQQAADGSFGGDPFVTALALRALHLSGQPPRDPTLAVLTGTVVDLQTNQPLSGVLATLGGPSGPRSASTAGGRFEFGDLPPGDYLLQLSLVDYAPVSVTVRLQAGQTYNLGIVRMVRAQGSATGTVQGTATDALSGQALAGVTVAISGTGISAATGADGSYIIPNAPIGTVALVASKTGYANVSGTATIAAGAVVLFSPRMVAAPDTTTAIQGLVTDGATSQPLAGATVTVSGTPPRTATTDAAGGYRIEGLTPGAAAVSAAKAGYDSVSVPVTLAEGSTLVFSPKLFQTGTTPPDENRTGITGRIVDGVSGAPIAGATVSKAVSVTTGADGRFTLLDDTLTGEFVTVQIAAPGYPSGFIYVYPTPASVVDVGDVRMFKELEPRLVTDLAIRSASRRNVTTDPQRLELGGTLSVSVINFGTIPTDRTAQVVAFEDANGNGTYEAATDRKLGEATVPAGLQPAAEQPLEIPLAGTVLFRGNLIHVAVDPDGQVAESDEGNNTRICECDNGLPFIEDFEDGVADGFIQEAQVYTVANGYLEGNGAVGSGRFGNNRWTDFDAELRVFFPGAASNDAGITFRHLDANSQVQFRIQNGLARIVERINGAVAVPRSATIPVQGDRWYTMRVEVRGTTVTAYLDGVKIFDFTGLRIPSGTVGVQQDGVRVRYDDVRVFPVEGVINPPDLTASYLRIQDNAGASPSQFTVRIGNGGGLPTDAGVPVAFYNRDPGTGSKTLLGTALTSRLLAPGEFEDVTLTYSPALTGIRELLAVVDDNGSGAGALTECREDNNAVALDLGQLPGSFSLTVTTDQAQYGANAMVAISASVRNTGSLQSTANVRFTIEDAAGATVTALPPALPVSIPGGATIVVTDAWNTGSTLAGSYRVRAQLVDGAGSPFAEALAAFTIVHAAGQAIAARVTTDKQTYRPSDIATIQSRITNVTVNQPVAGLTVTTRLLGPDGSQRWEDVQGNVALVQGALRDFVQAVALGFAPAGRYAVQLAVTDVTGQTVAASETAFDVLASSATGDGLTGTLQGPTGPVPAGATATFTATLRNLGNSPLSEVPVTLSIVDVGAGQVLAQWPLAPTLAQGQSFAFGQGWTVTGAPGAVYTAVLTAEIGGQVRTLAFTNVTIGAQSVCAPSSPQSYDPARFTPFGAFERLEARGGGPGAGKWEWGLGWDTAHAGGFVQQDLDWVSGKAYGWTLVYDGAGNGTLEVRDGATLLFHKEFVGAPGKLLRAGNALEFTVKTDQGIGAVREVAATVETINGMAVGASLVAGHTTEYSEQRTVYFLPALSAGFTVSGTVRLTFPGNHPPAHDHMQFLVRAGNVTCP